MTTIEKKVMTAFVEICGRAFLVVLNMSSARATKPFIIMPYLTLQQ